MIPTTSSTHTTPRQDHPAQSYFSDRLVVHKASDEYLSGLDMIMNPHHKIHIRRTMDAITNSRDVVAIGLGPGGHKYTIISLSIHRVRVEVGKNKVQRRQAAGPTTGYLFGIVLTLGFFRCPPPPPAVPFLFFTAQFPFRLRSKSFTLRISSSQ